MHEKRAELQAVQTIAAAAQVMPKLVVLQVFTCIAKHCISAPSFYCDWYLLSAISYTSTLSDCYCLLSPLDKTPCLLVSGSAVWNDAWTFESVRANTHIPPRKPGKWAWECVLHTDGIIQIGFATAACVFDAEAGTGVGDDGFSYAYDGHRIKKWHGLNPRNVCGF